VIIKFKPSSLFAQTLLRPVAQSLSSILPCFVTKSKNLCIKVSTCLGTWELGNLDTQVQPFIPMLPCLPRQSSSEGGPPCLCAL